MQMNNNTNSAENPLAHSSQQVSDVHYSPSTATFALIPYSRCGVVDTLAVGSGSGPHAAAARIDALTSGRGA